MIHNVMRLFICLFVICISCLVRGLLGSLAHFLIRLFVFLLLSVKSSLYILDNGPVSDVAFANIFFQSGLFSYSLDIVFHRAEVFYFNGVQFINYFLDGLCFWCI